MLVRMRVEFVPEVGDDGTKRGGCAREVRDPSDERLRHEIQLLTFSARNMRDRLIGDATATANGMNALVSGNNVKDTVKTNGGR